MTEKIFKNLILISIIIAGLVLAGAFVYINQSRNFSIDIGAEKAGEKIVNYINENILPPEITAGLVDISDAGSVYKVRIKIEETEFDSYVSKDGKFLFPEGYDMEESIVQEPVADSLTQPETPVLPQEEQEKMDNFVNCLKDKGMVVYGEDRCPYCQQLVAIFGGKEIIAPIYVDCEENQELCYDEKGVTGVPAIFINDEEYKKERSLESFALETGCEL